MEKNEPSIVLLPTMSVEPNRDQPRKTFPEEGIKDLSDSILKYGILEPLIVQKKEGYYSIVAGERRWRAAVKAKLRKIPVIIKDVSAREASEIALIENIQREELNPIEEAAGFKQYMETYNVSAYEMAERLSISRGTISHSVRLLQLPDEVKGMIIDGRLSAGHGKAILGLESKKDQLDLARKVVATHMSVRETEKAVRQSSGRKAKTIVEKDTASEAVYSDLGHKLTEALGTKVMIRQDKEGGSITIEYYSLDDFDRIYGGLMSGDWS